jgi:hypothetical protein
MQYIQTQTYIFTFTYKYVHIYNQKDHQQALIPPKMIGRATPFGEQVE